MLDFLDKVLRFTLKLPSLHKGIQYLLDKVLQHKVMLEMQPIYKRVLNGERVGVKSHWCSPYYELDVTEWEKRGWDSANHFMESRSTTKEWWTFDESKIEKRKQDAVR